MVIGRPVCTSSMDGDLAITELDTTSVGKRTMRIDNHILDPDRAPTPKEVEFWNKLSAILVRELDMPYGDIVRAFRQLEEEFAHHAGYNEWEVLETKRRIAECMLRAAHDAEQPFDVCHDNWNALVELGFSSIETFCNNAWFYADCCLCNGHHDAGIEVVDMVIAEIERRLEEPGLTRQAEEYYDGQLIRLGTLREGLVAYKSSEAEGQAWEERQDAEMEARQDPTAWEQKEIELRCRLFNVMNRVRKTSDERSFAEMVCAYRQVEADFLTQLESGDGFFVPSVRRHVAAAILEQAQKLHEPFDVCRDAWNELLRWGLGDLTDRCAQTRTYAECCRYHRQHDVGFGIVEPLLAELQKHISGGSDSEMPRHRYPREIALLTNLRDQLKALHK